MGSIAFLIALHESAVGVLVVGVLLRGDVHVLQMGPSIAVPEFGECGLHSRPRAKARRESALVRAVVSDAGDGDRGALSRHHDAHAEVHAALFAYWCRSSSTTAADVCAGQGNYRGDVDVCNMRRSGFERLERRDAEPICAAEPVNMPYSSGVYTRVGVTRPLGISDHSAPIRLSRNSTSSGSPQTNARTAHAPIPVFAPDLAAAGGREGHGSCGDRRVQDHMRGAQCGVDRGYALEVAGKTQLTNGVDGGLEVGVIVDDKGQWGVPAGDASTTPPCG